MKGPWPPWCDRPQPVTPPDPRQPATDPLRAPQRAVLIRKTREQLEAERDELFARLDGCTDDTCPHHDADLAALDTVQWLLDGCD